MYRKMLDNPIATNVNSFATWTHLLLSATHKTKTFLFNREPVTLKPGQVLIGRKKFSKQVGIKPTTLLYWLHYMKVNNYIDIKPTNKYSIVTIKNWHLYQGVDSKTDNRWTTDGQQMDTNKNDKNEKNVKNLDTNVSREIEAKSSNEINELIALFAPVNPSYKTLYPQKGQRLALERMINEHGRENVEGAIRSLSSVVGKPYAPVIISPYELEKKMGSLIAYLKKQQGEDYKFSVTKV